MLLLQDVAVKVLTIQDFHDDQFKEFFREVWIVDLNDGISWSTLLSSFSLMTWALALQMLAFSYFDWPFLLYSFSLFPQSLIAIKYFRLCTFNKWEMYKLCISTFSRLFFFLFFLLGLWGRVKARYLRALTTWLLIYSLILYNCCRMLISISHFKGCYYETHSTSEYSSLHGRCYKTSSSLYCNRVSAKVNRFHRFYKTNWTM